MKIYYSLPILLLVALLATFYIKKDNSTNLVDPYNNNENSNSLSTVLHMKNVLVKYYGDSGQIQYLIRADQAQHYPEKLDPFVNEHIDLTGKIHLQKQNEDNKDDKWQLFTEHMTIQPYDQYVEIDTPVEIRTATMQTNSSGMNIDLQTNQITFLSTPKNRVKTTLSLNLDSVFKLKALNE